MTKLDFIHIFIPSSEIMGKELEHSNDKDKLQLHPVCLLLLHGTGGDENDSNTYGSDVVCRCFFT